MWKELDYFKEYAARLQSFRGDDDAAAAATLSEALYIVSMGTKDFLENYYAMARAQAAEYSTAVAYGDYLLGIGASPSRRWPPAAYGVENVGNNTVPTRVNRRRLTCAICFDMFAPATVPEEGAGAEGGAGERPPEAEARGKRRRRREHAEAAEAGTAGDKERAAAAGVIELTRKRHVKCHVGATSAKTTIKLPRDLICTGFNS
uniref:Uncharacterized protein n=1 Tax=Oryza sativa subsp. japonica TaxID=39947 RepID=Q850Z9_ORYSJ|nr:hypothetical protein [Oryza sativa Japonica Group]